MAIGNMNIGAIYIGNQEITDIYKGSELLYSNTPPTITLEVNSTEEYLFGIKAILNANEKVDLTGKSKYKWNQSAEPIGADVTLYDDGEINEASQELLYAGNGGDNYLHVLASNTAGTKKIEYISDVININSNDYKYDYTGTEQIASLLPGKYKLECWGAQGGSYSTSYSLGGKGGYSSGIITLDTNTQFYIQVGGQGQKTSGTGVISGGYNGGGSAYSSSSSYYSVSGGGATDIRINNNSLYARVIVAGGGGGGCGYASSSSYYRLNGGEGGGISGINGKNYSTSYLAGTAGTATTAGISYYGTTADSTTYGTNASFGNGGSNTNKSSYGYGAGGGGWYGGGYGRRASGGGGSGYVYTDLTASNYPSGCLLNQSYYLSDASTVAGNTSFTSPTGSTETGHEGNGYIIITKVS